MNSTEGNYRVTFKNSRDVVLLNSDTKRTTYWKERGDGGHSLFTLFQTKVHYCRIGEPLIIVATAYDDAPTPHGIVSNIETSYHSEFAPACPELSGPVTPAGETLTSEEVAALFASIEDPDV